jgi:hypothetical protein
MRYSHDHYCRMHLSTQVVKFRGEDKDLCGCFYCKQFFEFDDIEEFVDRGTAICPKCGIDAVLLKPSAKDLIEMHEVFFSVDRKVLRA